MKLHTKLVISLFAGLTMVVVIAQVLQYINISGLITHLSHANIELLKEREADFAKNIYHSIDLAVAGSLERGEMEKFTELLKQQRRTKGLIEFSLYDQNGVVTHSSDDVFLKKQMPNEIKTKIEKGHEMLLLWNEETIDIYEPAIITKDCIRCHQGWVEGNIGGVSSFRFSTIALSKARDQAEQAISDMKRSAILGSIFYVSCIVIILSFTVFFLVRKFVGRPLEKSVEMLRNIAEGEGDLTMRLHVESNDEVGELAKWFNIFIEKLQVMVKRLTDGVQELNTSSTNLTTISTELANKSDQMNQRSVNAGQATGKTAENIRNIALSVEKASSQVASVADSSDQVSRNMEHIGLATKNVSGNLNSVAVASEQMSSAVNTIASAIEQMYSSLNEVAKNSGRCANVTNDASKKAHETSTMVNDLSDAAKEIGDVVELIKGIAAQTNLLALNAAIEAAGAGEAGKGFAVVANEVKELARQTAGATEDIRRKVEGMQNNTESAINAIGTIVGVITEINAIMSTIASAVEEQTATTNEISASISETASSANDVAKNVQEAAAASVNTSENLQQAIERGLELNKTLDEVAKNTVIIAKDSAEASKGTDLVEVNVKALNTAVEDTSQSAVQIREKAENLAVIAADLQSVIDQFKI